MKPRTTHEAFISPEEAAEVRRLVGNRYIAARLTGGIMAIAGAFGIVAGIAYGELADFSGTEAAAFTDASAMNDGLDLAGTANLLIESGAASAAIGIGLSVAAHELGRRREEDMMVARFFDGFSD